ncbi:MAG: type 3 domain protein [Segetibacter sp.]|nr:type 3 domain protein [Segetibacter sp.]
MSKVFLLGVTKKLLIVEFILILIVVSYSCRSRSMPNSELEKLKKSYSKEVINFFYETAFFQEYAGPKDRLSKWKDAIWISLEGDLWQNDSVFVNNTINQLNQLKLPVQLHLAGSSQKGNVLLYFGNFKYLQEKIGTKDSETFLGTGFIPDHASSIKQCKIGIANNAKSYINLNNSDKNRIRESIILEEITQALGITGDSWSHYNSIFFEGKESRTTLSKIDSELICFLYEKHIPINYSKGEFEKDFSDVLYSENSVKKILEHVSKNKVPHEHLKVIMENSFRDSMLLKFANHVFLKLKGSYQEKDLKICQKLANKINTISTNLKIEMVSDSIWYEVPSITIELERDSLQKSSVLAERFLTPGGMMFSRRVKGAIRLKYKNKEVLQKEGYLLLVLSVLKILGLDNVKETFASISNDDIVIQNKYIEVLSLLYNPIIPNSFPQKDMKEVIKELGEF